MPKEKMIQTPEELWELFEGYRIKVKSDPFLVHDFAGKDADEVHRKKEKPLTMEGFENYVANQGGPLDLQPYFGNRAGAYAEYVTICSRVKREIRDDQITGGMAGIYNPSITQRLNALVDRQEIKQTTTTTTVDVSKLSDEAIQEIIDAENRSDSSES